jgi:hypothetical protein
MATEAAMAAGTSEAASKATAAATVVASPAMAVVRAEP